MRIRHLMLLVLGAAGVFALARVPGFGPALMVEAGLVLASAVLVRSGPRVDRVWSGWGRRADELGGLRRAGMRGLAVVAVLAYTAAVAIVMGLAVLIGSMLLAFAVAAGLARLLRG